MSFKMMQSKFYNSDFYQVFLHGLHVSLGGKVPDPSFGRRTIPLDPYEEKLRRDHDYWWHEEYISYSVTKLDQNSHTSGHRNEHSSENRNENNYKYKEMEQEKMDKTKSRRYQVYMQSWRLMVPMLRPQAEVIIIHGIAAYGGYLANLIPEYCQAGFRTHLIDLPGHGRSDGIHADLTNMDMLISSVHAAVSRVKLYSHDVPILIVGYSLGGLVAIKYSMKHPDMISGLCLISPCIKINPSVMKSSSLINLGKVVAFVAPRLTLPSSRESKSSSNPNPNSNPNPSPNLTIKSETSSTNTLVDSDNLDRAPMAYTRSARIGTLMMILNETLHLPSQLHHLQLPFLVLQGEEDKMVDPQGALLLYKNADSIDKLVRFYPYLEHDLLTYPQVRSDSIDWLSSQVRRLEPPTDLQKF